MFVWGLGALFYLMGFFQRVAPAVMTAELMREFEIGAAALGNLSAFYFYSYVAMQIPTGIMVDRWGPRRLLAAGCLLAGTGTALFALAPAMVWAGVGRLLIGGSVAVAFVALLQIANNWFPPRYFAMVGGMALFFGIVGAVSAGPPLRLLLDHYSWRSVIMLTALITLALCLGIWVFVRDFPHEKGYADPVGVRTSAALKTRRRSALAGAVEVFKYRNTILLFLIPGGVVGCVLTFAGLWGVPFLATHHGLSTAQASALTSALLVAWAVGGPVFGWASDRLGSRKPLYIGGCAVALLAWLPVIFWPSVPRAGLVAALLLIGFSSGCMIVSFAYAKESVPVDLSGTVAGVINMGVMMGPTLLQPAVGWVLDHKWRGEAPAGVRSYGLEAYQSGFALMLVWAALALVLLFFTRETHCRQST
jgi:MFS family permease